MVPRTPAREPLAGLATVIKLLTGRPATPEEKKQFSQYLDLLIVWNRAQRLTGVLSPAAIVEDLFQDSLLFLSRLPPGRLVMADIGAGAGIPGVPLAIVRPEISLTLIESKRKRVSFLAALKRELGVSNVEILEGRAEDLITRSPELYEKFDVVVSRAVGPIHDLLPTVMAYLTVGGLFMGAGPPSTPKTQLQAMAALGVRCEVIRFSEVGLTRTFLLAHKREG